MDSINELHKQIIEESKQLINEYKNLFAELMKSGEKKRNAIDSLTELITKILKDNSSVISKENITYYVNEVKKIGEKLL